MLASMSEIEYIHWKSLFAVEAREREHQRKVQKRRR